MSVWWSSVCRATVTHRAAARPFRTGCNRSEVGGVVSGEMLLIRHGTCSTVVLAALVLAGCGTTPTSTPTPSPGASASEASESPPLGSGSPLANGPDKLTVELVVKGLDLPD